MRLGVDGFKIKLCCEGLFHFNADEPRLEHHLPGIYFQDVQFLRHFPSVEEFEYVIGRAIAVDISDVGVDVRERKVGLLLCERVERHSLRQYFTDKFMIAFKLRLLV